MSENNYEALRKQLEIHEGRRDFPYVDTVGKLTIGIGHNLTDNGLPSEIVDRLFEIDLKEHWDELIKALPWVLTLDNTRQAVLLDMAFNLGIPRLLKFRVTLASIEAGHYELAAKQMLESLWARQVKGRARTLAQMMKTGINPFVSKEVV